MGRLIIWFNIIIKKQKGAKRWQKVVTVMAAMITFATTYALILPAITVEKNSTEEVGGMYLEQTAEQDELLEENALEPNGVSIAADMDNAVTFSYADDDLTATAVFSTDEEIPGDAELVVNLVDPASEEYAALRGRSEGLLDKEFIYDVTTCSFYDYALVSDNVDVTPETGLVDIQIIFRNNTVQHIDDVVYAGRFARPSEDADGFVAMAVSTAEAEAEADDTVSMNGTAVNDNSAGESGDPSAGEDELVSLNIDESSVIELSDGIITSLSLKGSDLSRSDSLVGIIAGYVDEEIKAAAAETDAEVPEYDESQDEDEQRSSGEDASANADNNVSTSPEEDSSGTSAEDERKEITDALQMKTLKASGKDYTVTLTYDESSKIPEGASLTVSEISKDSKEYQTYLEETKKAMGLKEEETLPGLAARFFDIKIMVGGKEFNPESGVSVEITYAEPLAEHSETEVNAVHFADEKAEAEMIEANTAEVQDDGKATVEFTAESFSVYGVIYTVDFHYEINGKTYEYTLPGGGFVSFYKLVEVLGISNQGTQCDSGDENATENSEIQVGNGENMDGNTLYNVVEEAGVEDTGSYSNSISLNNVEVSEATRQFVADVASVEFSSPELVWVGKVNVDTTVGGLKDANDLEVQYSAELTEEQITEINGTTVEAGDWALISVHPFDTEESLTITMKNGDQFVVKVTDENITTGDLTSGEGYIIYTVYNNKIYALREDGSTGEFSSLDELDSLGNEYKWRFSHIYTEGIGWQADYGYPYYNIRTYNDDTKYLNLVSDGNNLVQQEAANVFITNHPNQADAYAFGGVKVRYFYNNFNLPVPMQMNSAGVFSSDTQTNYWGPVPGKDIWENYYHLDPSNWNDLMPSYAPMYIYQQTETAYEFMVQTEDIRKGSVSGTDKDGQTVGNDAVFVSKTIYTSSNTNKTNMYPITATPSSDRLVFSHWTLNDEVVTGITSATIPAHALRIPSNGAVLEAHFKKNLNYQPTDEELQGRDAIDKEHFDEWLDGIISERDPLVDSMCNKTAEVYDYENRIYRVDLTAGSKMSMFDGDIDLAFLIDVSSSMRFPSNLINATDVVNNTVPKDLRNIERDWNTWGLSKSKTYYVITDPEVTATVCVLFWGWDPGSYQNRWMMRDASKNPGTDEFRADSTNDGHQYYTDQKPHTLLIKEATDFVTGTETGSMAEAIQNAGLRTGDPKTRRVYLEASIKDAIKEMYSIKTRLGAASNPNEDYTPKIAYNQFCAYINGFNYAFQPAPQDGNVVTSYSYGGGTSTDIALLDAAGYLRSDVIRYGNDASHTGSHSSDWDKLTYTKPTYTEGTGNYGGFRWNDDVEKRYALLITDGAPQRSSRDIHQQFLEDGKNYLTQDGVTLVSVGLSMKDVLVGSKKLYNISTQDDLGVPYYYKADTGDQLSNVIYETLQSTISEVIITGKVTDTVNEAFYPVDRATGNPLGNNDWIDLDGNKVSTSYEDKHGVIKKENGKYTVEWENQSITNTGWHGTIYVKAKEDLVGGNAVPTNDGKATIETWGFKNAEDATARELKDEYKETKELNTPLVNINELSITNNSTDWTVYLGEEVDPITQLKALYDEIDVLQVIAAGTDLDQDDIQEMVNADSNTSRDNINMSYLLPTTVEDERSDGRNAVNSRQTFSFKTLVKKLYAKAPADAEWKENFNADGTPKWEKLIADYYDNGDSNQRVGLRIPYNPYGIPGENYITLKLDIAGKGSEKVLTKTDTDPHKTSETGTEVEKYTLTVQYDPDYTILPGGQNGQANISDFHVGNYESKYQGNAAGREEKENIHIINVYNVPLDVYKTDASNNPLDGVTFKLYKVDEENGSSVDGLDNTHKYIEVAAATSGADGIARLKNNGDDFYLELGETYYLIETAAPTIYQRDTTVLTVGVQVEIGKFTDLDGNTIPSTTYPVNDDNPPITEDMYPFNWDQGVRIMLDGNTPVPVIAKGETEGTTTTITDGSFVSYEKMISFRHTVINHIKTTTIPVEKTWNWSEEDEGKIQSWSAKFKLQYREVLESGTPDDPQNVQSLWGYVYEGSNVKEITVTNGSTIDTGSNSFENLPMYKVHSNESVYRLLYAVEESEYTINYSDGRPSTTWSRDTAGVFDTHYAPIYEEDAGQANGSYNISVTNALSNKREQNTIDLDIEKIWEGDDGTVSGNTDNYAKFRLKRYYHEEYLNLTGYNENDLVKVTLDFGGGKKSVLEVPKNAPVFITTDVKSEGTVNLTFNQTAPSGSSESRSLIYDHDNPGAGNYTHTDGTDGPVVFVFSDVITADTNQTWTLQTPSGSAPFKYILGGVEGIRPATFGYETNASGIIPDVTGEIFDSGFTSSDPLGQEFELNAGNHWTKGWDRLPQVVEVKTATKGEGGVAGSYLTTIVYSYYFEEVECNPYDYYTVFRDHNSGEYYGDINARVEASGLMIDAINKPIPETQLYKVDIAKLGGTINPDQDLLSGASFRIKKYKKFAEQQSDVEQVDTSWGTNGEKDASHVDPDPNNSGAFLDNGKFKVDGLGPGDYEIVEVNYPSGYIQTTNNPRFRITFNTETEKFEIVPWNSSESIDVIDATMTTPNIIVVGNTPGAALPNTGGPGTNLIYLLGLLLTSFAGTGILMKRRRRNAA